MGWISWTLTITTLAIGVLLTTVVMMQTTKSSRSVITGGNTFYGSNKGKTLDGILSKITIVFGALFIVACFLTTISIIK